MLQTLPSCPWQVRLLFGKAPVVPCIFTGMLCVRETQEGEVILASTVLNRRNVLLEIPATAASCLVRQATRDEDFSGLASFADAQKLCKKYALMFASLMKLSPELDSRQKTIQHVPTDLGRRDEGVGALDLITNISLTEEPRDLFVGESDTDSVHSEGEQALVPPGAIVELSLFSAGQAATTNACPVWG